jgi:hypothetical protein
MKKRIISLATTMTLTLFFTSTTSAAEPSNASFITIQPTWTSPGFSTDINEIFIDSNKRILLSQHASGYPNGTNSMLTVINNGTLSAIEGMKYPQNYDGSIIGRIGTDLFVVDEFFNGAPADDPYRQKAPNWSYPYYQKLFVKNIDGTNIGSGLDKSKIQNLITFTNNRILTSTIIKGSQPPAKGEKPQFIRKYQLLNSTNFSEPNQMWETQTFSSDGDPSWNPYIFSNDSVLLGTETPNTGVGSNCLNLIKVNNLGQPDPSWLTKINSLIQKDPILSSFFLVYLNPNPFNLNTNRLVFLIGIGPGLQNCGTNMQPAFLLMDTKGENLEIKIPNYPKYENWQNRDILWIECVNSDRCIVLDRHGKAFWTDQNLIEIPKSNYYSLLPPENLAISGLTIQRKSNPMIKTSIESTVKNWSAKQFLINHNQIVGIMDSTPNLQIKDPTLMAQWNGQFVASFPLPEIPKVVKTASFASCVKGKTIKKVALGSSCPKGYKKKV